MHSPVSRPLVRVVTAALLTLVPLASAAESQCFSTVSNGRIERSAKLPVNGSNFTSCSTAGAAAGRTHVHSKVAEIVTNAYTALAVAKPDFTYVYLIRDIPQPRG